MMGSGSAAVNATGRLEATLRGTGDIDVYGAPASREVNISGSGTVDYKD
jgi:hypothetical protein